MQTILVVEDEPKMRFVYSRLLSWEGFRVLEAPNCIAANEELKREAVDLVLLDLRLPDVGGQFLYDVMQLFHRRTRVLVASVYPVEKQRRLVGGASDYFDKSQGIDVLLAKVRGVLAEKNRPAPAACA